jgi:hypothetical protein
MPRQAVDGAINRDDLLALVARWAEDGRVAVGG